MDLITSPAVQRVIESSPLIVLLLSAVAWLLWRALETRTTQLTQALERNSQLTEKVTTVVERFDGTIKTLTEVVRNGRS